MGRALLHWAALLPQGMSETFETLHNLVHKGVKVVMDIPYELWNETSAEVADLKKQVPGLVGLALGGCHDLRGREGLGVLCWEQGCRQDLLPGPGPAPAPAACGWS